MDGKTIILSGINGNEQKAVLNFEKRVEGYGGNLRLYNFKEEPSGILTLAFLVGFTCCICMINDAKEYTSVF